jgi:hypothetical protein
VTFLLGFVLGVLAVWLLIGLALTAWLIWSLRRVVAAGAGALVLSGCAGSWLVVGGVSYHKDRDTPYNESHEMIAVQVPLSETVRAAAGRYENSKYRTSRFAAATWLPVRRGNFHFGGMVGGVDGYDRDDRSKRDLLLTPVLAYERRKWGLEFLPFNGEVLTLLLKLRF